MSNVHKQTKELLQKIQQLDIFHKKTNTPQADASSEASYEPQMSAPTPSPTTKEDSISFRYWEALSYELALEQADEPTIMQGYKITPEQLDKLKRNPFFAKMLRAKKEEVQALQQHAEFTVRLRMIVTQATPAFLQRLLDPETSSRDFHAMYKTAVELAQQLPQPPQVAPQPTGASVVFNIHGVPDLEHATGAVINSSAAVLNSDVANAQEVL